MNVDKIAEVVSQLKRRQKYGAGKKVSETIAYFCRTNYHDTVTSFRILKWID